VLTYRTVKHRVRGHEERSTWVKGFSDGTRGVAGYGKRGGGTREGMLQMKSIIGWDVNEGKF
jgi:hypothetical protein